MNKLLGHCPSCGNTLIAKILQCKGCGLELSNDFALSPFDYLADEQMDFLLAFLRNQGNMKALQDELNISYPFAKKKLEQVLSTLGLLKEEVQVQEEINLENLHADSESVLASEIIKKKLIESGGRAIVSSVNEKAYEIRASSDGKSFFCNQLPISPPYEFTVFDIIVDLLKQQGGRAKKGNGRNFKLGEPGCEDTTVVGAVAKNYSGKKEGASIFDPVFILAAILEWAGIANNYRGYIELCSSYRLLLAGE
ncbi:MAG: DUF2089 domain-containing protein [Clostridiales bacterium]|nr:DUF2089 domain-containing protein [Clostridiales bacterium]